MDFLSNDLDDIIGKVIQSCGCFSGEGWFRRARGGSVLHDLTLFAWFSEGIYIYDAGDEPVNSDVRGILMMGITPLLTAEPFQCSFSSRIPYTCIGLLSPISSSVRRSFHQCYGSVLSYWVAPDCAGLSWSDPLTQTTERESNLSVMIKFKDLKIDGNQNQNQNKKNNQKKKKNLDSPSSDSKGYFELV